MNVFLSNPGHEQRNYCHVKRLFDLREDLGELMQLPTGRKFANLGFLYALKKSGEESSARINARLVNRNHPFVDSLSWDEVLRS